jgi:hypothetical protein
MTRRSARPIQALALALAGLAAFAPRAQAQRPAPPVVPDLPYEYQRSGLMSRWAPPRTVLPHDKDRDHFYYGKKWQDFPTTKPNFPLSSGLYGLSYTDACTKSYAPYFFGYPGGDNSAPCCEPVRFRLLGNFVHPWRPVGGYYSGGSAVPIYDLDPIAPGPGLFPWTFIAKRQHQGG